MCKQFLQISKKQTNSSVEKWAKDIYGDFTEMIEMTLHLEVLTLWEVPLKKNILIKIK